MFSKFAFSKAAVVRINFLDISHALVFMFWYIRSRESSTDVNELLISLSIIISSSIFAISKCLACKNLSPSFSSSTSMFVIPVLYMSRPHELILVSRVMAMDWFSRRYLNMEKSAILDLNSNASGTSDLLLYLSHLFEHDDA